MKKLEALYTGGHSIFPHLQIHTDIFNHELPIKLIIVFWGLICYNDVLYINKYIYIKMCQKRVPLFNYQVVFYSNVWNYINNDIIKFLYHIFLTKFCSIEPQRRKANVKEECFIHSVLTHLVSLGYNT